MILLNLLNAALILGFMPDRLGLLLFGMTLIFSAAGLRRVLSKNDARQAARKFGQTIEKANR